jgi:hypothetical protein
VSTFFDTINEKNLATGETRGPASGTIKEVARKQKTEPTRKEKKKRSKEFQVCPWFPGEERGEAEDFMTRQNRWPG